MLQNAVYELSTAMYQKAAAQQQQEQEQQQQQQGQQGDSDASSSGETIDAEYEVVNDKK